MELPNVHPKKAFIIDALDKEIRLSFSKRIKNTLPEPYQALISEEKEKDSPDFKYNNEATPFAAQGREIAQLIRAKAADADFSPILDKIEQDAIDSGIPNPELASVDAFVTSICWVGSKSLSHVLACIERCKERFQTIVSTSTICRKQIITSVMDYWKDQTGVGVAILDKLLNYQILTPGSVVEWALIDHVARGTLLANAWTYELVEKTTKKVGSRVRSIVRAIRQPGITVDQKEELQQTLASELDNMKTLYATVQDAVISIRDGNQDEMMESSDALRAEDEDLLKAWGAKWAKVFQRKYAVEENWVREELARPIVQTEVDDQKMVTNQDSSGANGGVQNGAGNADADVDVDVDAIG